MNTAATLPAVVAAVPTHRAPNPLRIFLSECRYDFTRMMRTRTFSLSTIGFPLMFYVLFGLVLNRNASIGTFSVTRYLLGGYAVMGIVGAALFGMGISLANDLSAGWLELKRASPMPPLAYLLAKCVTACAFGLIIVSLLCTLAVTAGHVTLSAGDVARMLGLTALGAIPFTATGLLLALAVPPNAAPGVANLIYLPMSFLGGLWLPIEMLPKILQKFAPILPTYQLGQMMLHALGYPSRGATSAHAVSLFGYTLLLLGFCWIAFRRREASA